MKSFFAWIEDRSGGWEQPPRNKAVISLTPKSDLRSRRELTTLELAEVGPLFRELGKLVRENPGVFRADGTLRPIRGRTTLVIEHDLNTPLSLDLPIDARVISRNGEELDPVEIKPGTVIEYSPPPWR